MRQSAEDYPETILLLSREREKVRAVDVPKRSPRWTPAGWSSPERGNL